MRRLSPEFFAEDALLVARELLGKVIEYNGCRGMIVETEAYKSDPASHGYTITPRSEIMLTTYGHVYVYFIYGMYYCLNITTNKGDVGAVLIRAVEPLSGINDMKLRRKAEKGLCSGPGKLCQAFDITKDLNGTKINEKIKVFNYHSFSDDEIMRSGRIGIQKGKELEWRFFVRNSKFISKK